MGRTGDDSGRWRWELCRRAAGVLHVVVHVVVVGCGRVGTELSTALERDGHTVAVIDKNLHSFRRLPKAFAGSTVTGFGFDKGHLEEAGIERAEGFAAVTNGDNSNILSARIARETYEIENVVARIYDPRRAVLYQRLGIPTVAAVAWTTEQVLRRLYPNRLVSEWSDATGTITLVERSLPRAWAGHKLLALNEDNRFRLVALSREGQARLTGPEVIGQEGDVIQVVVRRDAMGSLEERLEGGPT